MPISQESFQAALRGTAGPSSFEVDSAQSRAREAAVAGLDVNNLRAIVDAALSSDMLDGLTPTEALEGMAECLGCSHPLWRTLYSQDLLVSGYACKCCGATPAFVKAAGGCVELSNWCRHELSGDQLDEIGEHLHFHWIGEGTIRSCDLLMPQWSQQ